MNGWFLGVCGEYQNDSRESRMSQKYHYFENNESFCGRYQQATDYFENGIESGTILHIPQHACQKCYKKWLREFHIAE
ncbi:MAG: hypothetical protein Q8873_00640 [Bacillota bacterium]|nr:hypothetical protein [Bacillota bacterium]